MTPTTSAVLCRYRYDPLDRLASTSPAGQGAALRFYCKSRLATHIQGAIRHTIFGHDEQLLAQQKHSVTGNETSLLATDQPGSVLHGVSGAGIESAAYSAYGYSDAENGLDCLMGFNGELRDPVSGHYLLGNGYRAFNPVLMRFNSPDSLSPFAAGGINCYAYCSGDPTDRTDPTGAVWKPVIGSLGKVLKRLQRQAKPLRSESASRRSEFMDNQKTTVLSQYPVLSNRKISTFSREFASFSAANEIDPFQVLSIGGADDLVKVSGSYPRRFVFTSKSELLVDPSMDLERRSINHAILASYRSPGSEVISAGMIARPKPNQVVLWNDSGHYYPGFSTLQPVDIRLSTWGAKVERVRIGNSSL
ncbi:RHS repeat-associated core domain-containing protein [Pseudomonas congelans]|uniref:RHS repeat-associated core domain-containing protein n=1 Tax=Pseudomonas congelans TaxID=200452 RepID=UPI000AC3E191|nr:RHS repeat-associated core domain-containing protein [Pseudomonas congelans]